MNLLDKIKSILNIDSGESKPTNRTAASDGSSYESNSSDPSGNGTVDTESDSADTEAKTGSPRETLTEVEEAEADADDASSETVVTPDADTEPGNEVNSEPDTQTEAETEAEAQTEMGTETDTDAQTDTEATSDAETIESEPVNVIKGVGATYAERLGEADIETIDELAAADPDALAEETEISAKRVERWVGRAERR